ncbi:MAG TPA: glycosyltransferase family 4 protein [Patescibacteria group bacterium]|nr:glycosyltransferase family 4 protein [Patescibacteria group bacterium]
MKVLYITTFYDKYGGAEVLIRETLEYFSIKNTVDVISVMPSSEVLSPNTTYNIDVEQTISFILDHVNRENYDLIHIFLGHSLLLKIAIELKKRGAKVLFHIIDAWFTFSYFKTKLDPLVDKDFFKIRDKFPESQVFKSFLTLSRTESEMEVISKDIQLNKFADIVLCCSRDVRKYIIKYHSASPKGVKLVPLYNRLNNSSKQKISANRINNIAYVGRISDSWKGFTTFLKATRYKDKALYVFDNTPNLHNYFSAFENYLKIDALKINIVNNVVDDAKIEAMEKIAMVVIPSIAEGFSFVMAEAMSLGKLVIVGAKFGGPKDVIKNGVNGFIFKPGDSKSLSDTIDKIDHLDMKCIRKISNNAVKTASRYSKKRYLMSLDKIYRELI